MFKESSSEKQLFEKEKQELEKRLEYLNDFLSSQEFKKKNLARIKGSSGRDLDGELYSDSGYTPVIFENERNESYGPFQEYDREEVTAESISKSLYDHYSKAYDKVNTSNPKFSESEEKLTFKQVQLKALERKISDREHLKEEVDSAFHGLVDTIQSEYFSFLSPKMQEKLIYFSKYPKISFGQKMTYTEIQEWLKEIQEFAESFKQEKREALLRLEQQKSGERYFNFTHPFRRGGATKQSDAWVIMPNGEIKEGEKKDEKRNKDAVLYWEEIEPEELALSWEKDYTASPHEFQIVKLPTQGVSEAHFSTVKEIEKQLQEAYSNERSPKVGDGWAKSPKSFPDTIDPVLPPIKRLNDLDLNKPKLESLSEKEQKLLDEILQAKAEKEAEIQEKIEEEEVLRKKTEANQTFMKKINSGNFFDLENVSLDGLELSDVTDDALVGSIKFVEQRLKELDAQLSRREEIQSLIKEKTAKRKSLHREKKGKRVDKDVIESQIEAISNQLENLQQEQTDLGKSKTDKSIKKQLENNYSLLEVVYEERFGLPVIETMDDDSLTELYFKVEEGEDIPEMRAKRIKIEAKNRKLV